MNEKVLKTLEYDKIIRLLCEHASSAPGREACAALLPGSDPEQIRMAQRETSDALARIWKQGSLSFAGLSDIGASRKRLQVGASLGTGELLAIRDLLVCTLRVKNFSRGSYAEKPDDSDPDGTNEPELREDSLSGCFSVLEPLSPLSKEISRCILSPDEIADDASPELRRIRRTIANTNQQIHSQLTSLISSASAKTYLQDALITMRNGRYCIPVKQEYRTQVPGMIHDQSATGATLFVEPMAVVKLNNTLKELELQEKEAIEAVLADLSSQAAGFVNELEANQKALTHLDFVFAKASLSKQLHCSEPILNTEKKIHLKEARHPLLNAKQVVPIDIFLGDAFDLLIVTGPNTGGKTVSLKTVGLLTLMGQAGLHIPAFEGSELSVFDEVYADIGDEQSIEQNLSTFSSHMGNVVRILEKATPDSLVLFDELGSGTDPVEGAALAMSILTFLHNMQIRTMATTHYSELKLFALSTEGVENASCEFDVETLRPTYRLLIGIPGKSNAFAISGKLGLPEHIIADARNRITENNIAFEDILADLEKHKREAEAERIELEQLRRDSAELRLTLENQQKRLEERKDRILAEAREEAALLLQDAKDFADRSIREMNRLSAAGDIRSMEQNRSSIREKLERSTESQIKQRRQAAKKHEAKDFKVGDAVHVLSMGLDGTVSTLPDGKGNLYIQMGILRSQVNIRDLELIDEPVVTAPNLQRTSSGRIKMSKSASISSELNLLGMTTDEAVFQLDKYLDDAYLSNLTQVRIVHGKGTGALRKAVHNYLRRQKHVKEFHLAEYGEGDAGVTIVKF